MRFETHSHSHFSNIRIIDSINKPKDLILGAYKLGYAGITLTDHEALCGHVEWLEEEEKLKKDGKISPDFKCALGNEIYLVNKRKLKQRYWHFILIAKNTQGHRALRELSSTAWLNSYYDRGTEWPATLKEELREITKKYPDSLIGLNACIGGELGGLVLQLTEAELSGNNSLIYDIKHQIAEFISFCLEIFGDDFYLEIAPGISPDQKKFNSRIKSIGEFYNLKMILATDAHYLSANDREIHKAFLNSKEAEREVDSFYHDSHLMSDEEAFNNIKQFFSKEDFNRMCANSIELMNKIGSYEIFHNPIIPQVNVSTQLPYIDNNLKDYPTLFSLRQSDNPQERFWVDECLKSLKEKSKENNEYLNRLELEADIIKYIGDKLENCLFSYFNTFYHYIDLMWECGAIIGPGRGSAGSFLSNYLLGITQIDPIEWELPYFRFLNKERAELPDIDIDLPPSKRSLILKKIREERGELNVVQVSTFGTESAKAAIGCACRGYRSPGFPKGIDSDISQYMSSLVPIERGISWSLEECIYGNEEKERKPIKELINRFNEYPGLLEVALGIQDLVCSRGQHASGVILYNNSPYETSALMKSSNGDLVTQFDLHKLERLGDTKFDFLVTDICDKLSITLDLLIKDSFFKEGKSKREIYKEFLHPESINLKDERIWDNLSDGNIQDVFQFNSLIGEQTIKAIKPRNPAEMTSANALMRLTAPEGQDRPFDRYIKFKNNLQLWYQEMDEFGLTKEEQKILEPYYLRDYGVPASQERLMLMVMDPKISNFTLAESNNTRKVLAKKKIEDIPKVKEKFLSQCPSPALGAYAWRTMMEPQMSYSFSEVHSLEYSFIGIQTVLVATAFPRIYWETACLIVNSQSIEEEIEGEVEEEITPIEEEEEDEEEVDSDEDELNKKKKKLKVKTPDYGRVAIAIGKIKETGVKISLPEINDSSFTFSPDAKNNMIIFGLSGITRVSRKLIKEIIVGRPYNSLNDFLNRIKVNKLQMVNLIKCGAFDCFGNREQVMREYIESVSDTKKRVTLQNLNMLIDFNLIPDEYDLQRRIYKFNKYLKKMKNGSFYDLDEIAFNFWAEELDCDLLTTSEAESGFSVFQIKWDSFYQKHMDIIRPFVQKNSKELLKSINNRLISENWIKYCKGTLSKWEMDSISFYFHEHELTDVNEERYDCVNYFNLPEEPEIEAIIRIKGKSVPLYKIVRIMGTVIDKDKQKKTITILTKNGVVPIKIYGQTFSNYDRQISEIGVDGKKHVVEKSIFSRGNKLIITGVKRENMFLAKKYRSTPYHLIEKIEEVREDGTLKLSSRSEREI